VTGCFGRDGGGKTRIVEAQGEAAAMRYSGYGVQEFAGLTESRTRARGEAKGPGIEMGDRPRRPEAKLSLPHGVTEKEAAFFLGIFARLKEKRFGRVDVTVREGNVTDVEFVERVDRNLLRVFGA
jgi:hypothetical protein